MGIDSKVAIDFVTERGEPLKPTASVGNSEYRFRLEDTRLILENARTGSQHGNYSFGAGTAPLGMVTYPYTDPNLSTIGVIVYTREGFYTFGIDTTGALQALDRYDIPIKPGISSRVVVGRKGMMFQDNGVPHDFSLEKLTELLDQYSARYHEFQSVIFGKKPAPQGQNGYGEQRNGYASSGNGGNGNGFAAPNGNGKQKKEATPYTYTDIYNASVTIKEAIEYLHSENNDVHGDKLIKSFYNALEKMGEQDRNLFQQFYTFVNRISEDPENTDRIDVKETALTLDYYLDKVKGCGFSPTLFPSVQLNTGLDQATHTIDEIVKSINAESDAAKRRSRR